jgi:hypothetical protein
MKRKRLAAAIAVWACLAIPADSASACAYDGLLGYGLKAAHPRSIAVAVSVREAIESGVLPSSAVGFVPGNTGYWRAVRRLSAFQRLLSSRAVVSPVWVLMVDSNLWTRIRPAAGGLVLDVHMQPASRDATVIIPSESAIAALTNGDLTAESALHLGLIEVDGNPDAARRLKAEFAAGRVEPGARVVTARQNLFGSRLPARTQE